MGAWKERGTDVLMSGKVHLAMAVAFAALGGCAGKASPPPQIVTMLLSDYRFTPDHLSFQRGTTYRLHLENRGKELHEFTAPEFFKAVIVRNPDALVPDGHEVVLQPKEVKDVYFTPVEGGVFPLSCADHDWEGMIGTIKID
jgi:uncharacterized cupredoxin-like copper-binding protein